MPINDVNSFLIDFMAKSFSPRANISFLPRGGRWVVAHPTIDPSNDIFPHASVPIHFGSVCFTASDIYHLPSGTLVARCTIR